MPLAVPAHTSRVRGNRRCRTAQARSEPSMCLPLAQGSTQLIIYSRFYCTHIVVLILILAEEKK